MKKSIIIVLIFVCMMIGIFLMKTSMPEENKMSQEVLDDVETDDAETAEVDETEATEETDEIHGVENIEIPSENAVEEDNDGDVELPEVPIQ